MIKPSNIDFTTPMAALLSYEKARFSGYDLEASTEEPVVLEEHPDYTLIGIKLKTTGGKDILRKIKAFKNGAVEVIESPLTITQTGHVPETLNFTVALVGGGDWLSGRVFTRPLGSTEPYAQNTFMSANGGPFNIGLNASLGVTAYQVYFEVDLDGEVITSSVITALIEQPQMTYRVVDAPEFFTESQAIDLEFTPNNYNIGNFYHQSPVPGVAVYRIQGNTLGIDVDRTQVWDGTEIDIVLNVDGVEVALSAVYNRTDLNGSAQFDARLTFEEDGLDVHRAYANPGDIVYLAIEADGLIDAQDLDLELVLDNTIATIDVANPVVLQTNDPIIVPILIESASSADASLTVLVRKNGVTVAASRPIAVAQVAVVPTEIILNPQDGHIGGTSMGLSYSFDVPNYSAHNLTVSTNQAGVTFETFSPENNLVEEGTIHAGFDQSKIPDLTVINIVVNIDGLTKTTAMTYHHS